MAGLTPASSNAALSIRPLNSFQISASTSSMGLRGATNVLLVSSVRTGAGSARRSTLPDGINGSSFNSTNEAGTMYSGSLVRR